MDGEAPKRKREDMMAALEADVAPLPPPPTLLPGFVSGGVAGASIPASETKGGLSGEKNSLMT